jgi:hypothetical protein
MEHGKDRRVCPKQRISEFVNLRTESLELEIKSMG